MLNTLHYSSGNLPTNPSTPDATLTSVANDLSKSRFGDLSKDPAASVMLNIESEETKGNITRIMIQMVERKKPEDAAITAEQPYEIKAHLVVSYDRRYSTQNQIKATVRGLLSTLCNTESGSSTPNVYRIIAGER